MLNLLVRTANASVAQRAALELGTALRIRITPQVAQHRGETSLQIPSLAMRVESTARAVEMALPACRSRSPRDFAVWIERRVRDHLDGEPTTPGALSRHRTQTADDALGLLTAPRDEREAVLHAVLLRLSAPDRAVIEARLRPRATWPQVAATLGVSETTARARYERAVEHAQLLVLDVLSEHRQHGEGYGREFDQAA